MSEERESYSAAEQPVSVADLVKALQLNPFCDLVGQSELVRLELDELRSDRQRLIDNIERLGRERDQMVAANVELQERLSALEDDGK